LCIPKSYRSFVFFNIIPEIKEFQTTVGEANTNVRVGFTKSGLKFLNFRNNIEEYKAAVRLWDAQLSD
jgi:hypothetical protein